MFINTCPTTVPNTSWAQRILRAGNRMFCRLNVLFICKFTLNMAVYFFFKEISFGAKKRTGNEEFVYVLILEPRPFLRHCVFGNLNIWGTELKNRAYGSYASIQWTFCITLKPNFARPRSIYKHFPCPCAENNQQIDFSKYNSSFSQIFDCEVHDRPNEEREKLEGQFIL